MRGFQPVLRLSGLFILNPAQVSIARPGGLVDTDIRHTTFAELLLPNQALTHGPGN